MTARERAVVVLAERLRKRTATGLDDKGYVRDVAQNLVGPFPPTVKRAFASGAGQELLGKMRAPHSSSALAVNSFLPWADEPRDLELAGYTGFQSLEFERQCSTGMRGTPPHLDVLLRTRGEVVAVESKCLEYLTPKAPSFSDPYGSISDDRAKSRWFQHVRRTSESNQHLDVGQLVKHYLGLAREFPGTPITLLYVYWEPQNWREVPECIEHRAELQRFAFSLAGDDVRFASLSYPELWDLWEVNLPTAAQHIVALRERYMVSI